MKKKLKKVKSTINYKPYELVEKTDNKWLKVDKNKALQSYEKRFKPTSRVENAFRNHANSYSTSNIKVRGLKGPSYIKYRDQTLIDCVEEHNGLKILLEMSASYRSKTTNELIQHNTRLMATDIEIQFYKMETETFGGGGGGEAGTYIHIHIRV